MHIQIKNETTGEVEGVLCIDRATRMCTVLQADIESLDDLVQIALAMKVPEIFVFVPEAAVAELESYGWAKTPDRVLMYKKGANGSKSTSGTLQ